MEVKAPNKYDKDTKSLKIFLGGAIDMGKAVDWQKQIANAFEGNDNVLLLNPRRDNWDSSWEQTIENKHFKEQVEWELDALDDCDFIVMVLTKDSKAPISLLELGLHAKSKKLLLFCEDGFYRKGNVDIVAKRYQIHQLESIDEIIEDITIKSKRRDELNETLKRFSR